MMGQWAPARRPGLSALQVPSEQMVCGSPHERTCDGSERLATWAQLLHCAKVARHTPSKHLMGRSAVQPLAVKVYSDIPLGSPGGGTVEEQYCCEVICGSEQEPAV